ncbi:MAG: 50S ribosomal protein L31 [Patescibacteria group bacterium]|jgi:large subunit ribosomal protein L31
MKKEIHPQYHTDTKVTCACGNSFVTGSTLKEIRVELCNQCHPFYTGKQKFVDTARRVEKFQEKMSRVSAVAATRKGKKAKKAVAAKKKAEKVKASKKTEK